MICNDVRSYVVFYMLALCIFIYYHVILMVYIFVSWFLTTYGHPFYNVLDFVLII